MSYLTACLLTSWLQGGAAVNEFLRGKMEEGANAVLQAELAGFLGCEKHSSTGWHTGNSRNGFYQRTIVTSYGKITVYENFHTFYRLHSSNVASLNIIDVYLAATVIVIPKFVHHIKHVNIYNVYFSFYYKSNALQYLENKRIILLCKKETRQECSHLSSLDSIHKRIKFTVRKPSTGFFLFWKK